LKIRLVDINVRDKFVLPVEYKVDCSSL